MKVKHPLRFRPKRHPYNTKHKNMIKFTWKHKISLIRHLAKQRHPNIHAADDHADANANANAKANANANANPNAKAKAKANANAVGRPLLWGYGTVFWQTYF